MPNVRPIGLFSSLVSLTFALGTQAVLANDTLDQLLDERKCAFCDLRSIDLGTAEQSVTPQPPVDLSDAYLVHADFSQARLNKVVFVNAYLNGARFVEANLRHTDFTAAELELADFTGADVEGAIFSNAYLVHARLSAEQLNRIKLCNTVLPDASVSHRDCDK